MTLLTGLLALQLWHGIFIAAGSGLALACIVALILTFLGGSSAPKQ